MFVSQKDSICVTVYPSIHDFLWLFSAAHLVELVNQCWFLITIAKGIRIISIHNRLLEHSDFDHFPKIWDLYKYIKLWSQNNSIYFTMWCFVCEVDNLLYDLHHADRGQRNNLKTSVGVKIALTSWEHNSNSKYLSAVVSNDHPIHNQFQVNFAKAFCSRSIATNQSRQQLL